MAESPTERYRLERKISGKGSFGEVWLATDTLLDRPVAIKCPKASDDLIRRERFLTEARMLARLNHPNITQIHDAFFDEEEGNLYLVMEYVDGKDLSEIIGRGTPLSLDLILEITLGVLRALSYAHGQGVVHRDVKPANVMIADEVKLTDFGLASLRSILERGTSFAAGTPAYMAPEQIEGRVTDGRADLYALGVLLFEMLSDGRLPFEHADQDEMLDAHLHLAPTPISQFEPTVPPPLEQLIMRLLAKDPEARYPSADAVTDALDSVQVGPKRTNLPIALTSFVGRQAELAEIQALLQDPTCRLLTLVGLGGSGKTRLALEAAAAQIHNYAPRTGDFADGVFFVPLAPLNSIDSMVPTVAEAVGLRFYEEGEARQQLLDYLRHRRVLLILDSYEHLLASPEPGRRDGVALVTDMLETAPDLRILVTSRTRLNVQCEHILSVAGMDFPDESTTRQAAQSAGHVSAPVGRERQDAAQYSAVQLFLQSARRVLPAFEPTADDMMDVVQICRLMQGMPLGILMAAAWVELLTPAEIAVEINRNLDFLETNLSDIPARQRSMRAVFDHAWQLLTEREREVFQALSVFRGGFTWQAAQEVTGAALRELMALLNKSLLHRMTRKRYGVHELLGQYAIEKLDQVPAASEAARDRHSAYYAATLQEWNADLKGPRQQTALVEIESDIENARAAWNWAIEQGQNVRLGEAVEGLGRFYEWRGRFQEGEAACRAAAGWGPSASSGQAMQGLARVLAWHSVFCRGLGRSEDASQLLQDSLALLERPELAGQDTRPEKAFTLGQMGHLAMDVDLEVARGLYEQSLALYQRVEDRFGEASALEALGQAAHDLGSFDEAKQLVEESLVIRQALGDQRGIADSLMALGLTALYQGEFEGAERLARASIAIRQKMGDRAGIARGLSSLGTTFIFLGKFAEARSLLGESVAIYHELGSRRRLARTMIDLGHTQAHLGDYDQARIQGQASLALSREIGYRRGLGHACWVLGFAALAEEAYAEAEKFLGESATAFREIGQREDLGAVLGVLGIAARGQGQLSQAQQHVRGALRIAAEIRAFGPSFSALRAMALLLIDQGDSEQAVELYALVSRYPVVSSSRVSEDIVGRYIAAVAATLPPEVVSAAQTRGRARDLDAAVAEFLAELGG